MADITIAGIMRSGSYSPNHIGNDAAIFNMVCEQLRKRGCEVHVYSEDEFNQATIGERFILNMCRQHRSMLKLQQLEDAGAVVINSGYGIENCTRERMTLILTANGIPYPESLIVNTDEKVRDRLAHRGFGPTWVKKGDGHSKHREDVSYARHVQEAQELVQEFFLRGISRAVINRHIEGDLVKFYGVVGSPFFYWFNPLDTNHSKFGLEAVNGSSHHLPFDTAKLKAYAAKAAEAMDIKIYGGDCIIGADGSITIIDFNDWPSYAPCRQEAAPAIAKMVYHTFKAHL